MNNQQIYSFQSIVFGSTISPAQWGRKHLRQEERGIIDFSDDRIYCQFHHLQLSLQSFGIQLFIYNNNIIIILSSRFATTAFKIILIVNV